MKDDLIKVPKIEKVGLEEWFQVRQHSRSLYVTLDGKDTDIHDIKMGDYLRLKIVAVKRGPRE
jgi:hypothetical protein